MIADGTEYVLYALWQQRLYLCGLIVCDPPNLCRVTRLTMLIAGHSRIPVHRCSVFVAGPTCVLRTIPSLTHSFGIDGFHRSLVSPQESTPAARPYRNSDLMGTGPGRPSCHSPLEKYRKKTHNCYHRSFTGISRPGRCGSFSGMAIPPWATHVSLHALLGPVDITSIYGRLDIKARGTSSK